MQILYNCDMGEGYGAWTMGADEALMPLIDQANIACGLHAGDPDTMSRTIALAAKHKVAIGAHPGYPDRQGFGRRDFPLEGESLMNCLLYQLGALAALCDAQGVALKHIKPHGALYNKMMRDDSTLNSIMNAAARFDAALPLMLQAGDSNHNARLNELAKRHGISLYFEAFADRGYSDDGQLASRQKAGAVYEQAEQIIEQARQLSQHGQIISLNGHTLNLQADSLCFHGDNPASLQALQQLRELRIPG